MTWSLAWVTGMEAIPENKRRGEEGRHRDGKGLIVHSSWGGRTEGTESSSSRLTGQDPRDAWRGKLEVKLGKEKLTRCAQTELLP